MFARKAKSSDIMTSVQRFTDMNRDSVSRVKHLKFLLDTLSIHEKRQLIDDYSFETFHLVDELLLATDIASNPQGAIEAESGLWTLEQVLCLAPELVGNGWQRHAIESLLKKAIYPRNLLAVRKIAIRLFLIFYQSLSVFGKVTPDLDRVFQCLLPFFPLRNGDSTELVLQEYCQSAGTVHWTDASKSDPPNVSGPTAKERAQMLQVYLDKFLEYCTRESTRIEWNDDSRRLECAKFIIDRVIHLYIYECFPDLETNGVDIFGGWEGAGDSGEPLDTADPVVIARYWLIRWINNVAGAKQQPAGSIHAGMLLFHDALFSSQKATNTALTLMREAMVLPLPCSNVIHKVVSVLTNWLVQIEIPPFVASGEVSIESSSLLIINMLLSFFQSPYLLQPGDRVQSTVGISFSILRACRDLVANRIQLPKPLSVRVWTELMIRLCESAARICSHSDKSSQETSGAFATTVLSNMILLKAVRRIELDDKLWDDIHNVFQHGIWAQMAHQWSKIVRSVTRALVLHLAHTDIFSKEELERQTIGAIATKSTKERADTASIDEHSVDSSDVGEDNVFHDTDDVTTSVVSWSGDSTVWLQVWRRVLCLFGPYSNANAITAIEAISQTITQLLQVNLDPLAHWLSSRLVNAPIQVLPHCIGALGAVLNCSRPAPKLLQTHILLSFQRLIQANDRQVLPYVTSMSPTHLSVLSPLLIQSIPKLLANSQPPQIHLLKALALISTEYNEAEAILLKQLSSIEMTIQQSLMCMNALTLLVLQRADLELMNKLLTVLQQNRYVSRLLPVLCSSLSSLTKFCNGSTVLQALLKAASVLRDERTRTEIEWAMTSLCLSSPQKELPLVIRGLLADKHKLLEGAIVTMGSQFPLPGFNVARWNSIESPNCSAQKNLDKSTFVHRKNAIISVNKDPQCEVTSRTVVGRHCWTLEPHANDRKEGKNVNSWLKKEAMRGKRAGREASGILGAMEDPFDALPQVTNNNKPLPVDIEPWVQILESSRRQPQPLKTMARNPPSTPSARLLEWRSLAASFGFVPSVAEVPQNFNRDLKHLDSTSAREVHKVAVIYVAEDQEDKQSIMSNTSASAEFDRFVEELGWEVRIGIHEGYSGGLPIDSVAPYYATPDSEIIFHVNTKLSGDVTHKWKHIGNDEVHVVWSEHTRAYRRETIATKFCDVLIVLEKAGEKTYRVRVETTSSLEFGPLYDGALVGEAELAEMVRLTVINASRAYRLAREDHARPIRHREHVFGMDTKRHMKSVHLADAINTLYVPSMMCE
ncbi:unnamed protein product [Auanema sp. JU1783]|nr:unnamed protein product [Auanema sp. JU1783]